MIWCLTSSKLYFRIIFLWRQATSKGVMHSFRKNTFKKIHCLNHDVGELRYLACNQGQIETRCGEDGLISLP